MYVSLFLPLSSSVTQSLIPFPMRRVMTTCPQLTGQRGFESSIVIHNTARSDHLGNLPPSLAFLARAIVRSVGSTTPSSGSQIPPYNHRYSYTAKYHHKTISINLIKPYITTKHIHSNKSKYRHKTYSLL